MCRLVDWEKIFDIDLSEHTVGHSCELNFLLGIAVQEHVITAFSYKDTTEKERTSFLITVVASRS